MKAATLLAALALLGSCKTPGAGRDAEASAAILSVLAAQEAAWNRGDIEGFMRGYAKSPEITFASGGDLTKGWQETFDRYRKNYHSREKMGHLEFADLRVEMISPAAATVTGRWALARENDRPHGLFTLLLRKLPDGWRIVHDHTSAAKP